MQSRYFEITAQGRGSFPIDMLRFGQLYPVGVDDARNIEPPSPTDSAFKNGVRNITLATTGSYMKEYAVIQRFASFGWNAEVTKEIKGEER